MKPKLSFICIALLSLSLTTASLQAQVPPLLNYQGKLAINGAPATNMVTLIFSIYPSASGGTALWSETKNNVSFTNGLFNVQLGEVNSLPNTLFTRIGELYLGIKIGTESAQELTPRSRLSSVAFAIRAKSANSLAPDGSSTDAVIVDNNGKIGIGTTQPTEELELSSNGETGIKITSTGDNVRLHFAPTGFYGDIVLTTVDGNDTKSLRLGGGGNVQIKRGAMLELRGNEFNGGINVGDAILSAGDGGRILLSNGNVGIGTDNPTTRLTIAKDNTVQYLSGNALQFTHLEHGESYIDKADVGTLVFRGGTNYTPTMAITSNGNVGIGATVSLTERLSVEGNIKATGSITPGSSRELKENIAALSSQEAITTFDELNPVKFTYKADAQKDLHIGFIAEDVPELVATPDRKGISPMDVVAVLTKVVQEQQKTIAELQNRVKSLEERQK